MAKTKICSRNGITQIIFAVEPRIFHSIPKDQQEGQVTLDHSTEFCLIFVTKFTLP